MTLFHFGERTGTDRYLNGPYKFSFTLNGLYALGSGIVLVGLIVWSIV